MARFASWSREAPTFARGLGRVGTDLPTVPALFVSSKGVVVGWCEEDGAWTVALDEEGVEISEPRLALAGARRLAFAGGRAGATLFGADGYGICSVPVDASGAPLSEPTRHWSETRSPAILSAARVRQEDVLVFSYVGDPGWAVLVVTEERGTVVRHRLRGACEDVRVRAIGSRASSMIRMEGGEVRLAVIGAGGKIVERPHPVFTRGLGPLSYPDVVWADDHWVALSHETAAGRIQVQPVGDKGASFVLPRCAGPFAAAYHSQRFYVLEVEPGLEESELRLWRCDREGNEQQQRTLRLALEDAAERRIRRTGRQRFSALADRMARVSGYRGKPSRPRLDPEGTRLTVLDERGRASLVVRRDESTGAFALRVVSAAGEDEELPEAPSSLVRLAAWVRRRLSVSARTQLEVRRSWAEEVASLIDAELESFDASGNTLVFELVLAELPTAAMLEAWLRELRDGPPPAHEEE